MRPRRPLSLILAVTLLSFSACLEYVDEEIDYPGSLSSGYLQLSEFPKGTDGIAGMGPFCRRVHDCGCPILDPEEVERCRENVSLLEEPDCQSMLERAVPECLP